MITRPQCTALVAGALLALRVAASAGDYPQPTEGDFVIRDFKFASGESLPELRIHYRSLDKAVKDARGVVRNAVLITHGTTGSGAQFIRPEFAGELFGAGQPLDAAKFFLVMPDGIGMGNRANRAMSSAPNFHATAIRTWSRRSFACLPKAWT